MAETLNAEQVEKVLVLAQEGRSEEEAEVKGDDFIFQKWFKGFRMFFLEVFWCPLSSVFFVCLFFLRFVAGFLVMFWVFFAVWGFLLLVGRWFLGFAKLLDLVIFPKYLKACPEIRLGVYIREVLWMMSSPKLCPKQLTAARTSAVWSCEA